MRNPLRDPADVTNILRDPAYILGISRGAILETRCDPLDDEKVDRILVQYLRRRG